MGMFVRALAYILSHGADGLRQAAEDAVLSANYIRASLADLMSAPFGDRPCMHEALFDDRWLKDTGVTTLDFAKAMIDEGYHPMTIYFPLVVHGAMLIEPTESESKASLDLFIMTLRDLALSALGGRARALPRRAASTRRAAGSTRRGRRASRCCAGRSPRPPEPGSERALGAAAACSHTAAPQICRRKGREDGPQREAGEGCGDRRRADRVAPPFRRRSRPPRQRRASPLRPRP